MRIDLRNIIFQRIFINLNYNIKNTIIVAGTGRSGTTWVANIINYKNEYRDMFEPFFSNKTKDWQHYPYKLYMRPDDIDKKLFTITRKILSGEVRNGWIDKYNSRFLCNYRIIKEIRVNLFLKWISLHFREVPIVFVIRHPCAVAYSRMKLGWDTHLKEILIQKKLIDDFLIEHLNEIKKPKNKFSEQIYLWAIENYVPLSQFRQNDNFYLLIYENLCINPRHEITKLFHWIGKKIMSDIDTVIYKPSQVTEKHSAIVTGENLISNWTHYVNPVQIRETMNIIQRFNLDSIYNETPYPELNFSLPV